MKIVVDAMGGDNAPFEIVKGAIQAAEELGAEIILVGRGEEILRCLDKMGRKELPAKVEIANAAEVIDMHDDPANAVRSKPDSSMTVGLKLVHDGKADAMVSAGSTGALISGATLVVKRIKGVRRAALAPLIPNGGKGTLLIDCGANAECSSEYLIQFAFMGYYYAKTVMGISDPRVALLNIGAEDTKGDALRQETYKLLKTAGDEGRINFIGNVEARDVMLDKCDVVVTDGFTGNVLLKTLEGMGIFAMGQLKRIFMGSTKAKIAAAMVKDDIMGLKKMFDSSEVGGTAMLGISKPVIKAHGSSDAAAIKNAVRQAMNAVSADVCGQIAASPVAEYRVTPQSAEQ